PAADRIVDHRAGDRLASGPRRAALATFSAVKYARPFGLRDARIAVGLRATVALAADGIVFAGAGGRRGPFTAALAGVHDTGTGALGLAGIAIGRPFAASLAANRVVDRQARLIAVARRRG